MTSLILYGSYTKLTNAHKLVSDGRLQPEYYVRIAIFHGDELSALEKATPMAGETVLNTIPLELGFTT